jgi:hypothetical protein
VRARGKPPFIVYLAKFLTASCARYIRSCVKNCVKVAIGRKVYFTPQDVFFRLYVRQLMGRGSIRKITCLGFTGEGAGSQALMVMNAMNFAHICRLTYVHTPFAEIAHADRPMEEWVGAWEAQFNFGAGEKAAEKDDPEVVNFAFNFTDLLCCFGVEDLTRAFSATLPGLRRKYYLNKTPRTSEPITVCVHIRRGDVTSQDHGMWTGTRAIARTVSRIKSILESHALSYTMNAFSQGQHDDFAELSSLGVDLFLDADAVWTMQELVEADILIMAKSAFSYVAALLGDGIKICEPDSYPPLEPWLVRRPSGDFDEQSFEQQLQFLIKSKPPDSSASR